MLATIEINVLTSHIHYYNIKMDKRELNELLRNAIYKRNVEEIERLLRSGADPNYQIPEQEYNGTAEYKYQPYSPLRLVVFIISDAMAADEELAKDPIVADLLLKYGANAKSAVELIELRYGTYNPEMEITPFSKVLNMVYDAIKE